MKSPKNGRQTLKDTDISTNLISQTVGGPAWSRFEGRLKRHFSLIRMKENWGENNNAGSGEKMRKLQLMCCEILKAC